MSEISRAALFGKLNAVAYRAIDSGTTLCKQLGNPYVELAHWVAQILEVADSDFVRVLRHFGLDNQRVRQDVREALERLPRGATSIVDFSAPVLDAAEHGWIYSTLMFGFSSVRTGTLLIAILKTPSTRAAMHGLSKSFQQINVEVLTDSFAKIVAGSPEDLLSATDGTSILTNQPKKERDIFICYRRQDSVHQTGRIFDRLAGAFGRDRIFKDVNSIPRGTKDFSAEIQAQLESARVMLVIVGGSWLSACDSNGRRRLDDKDDYVRVELKWGLQRKEVSVLPVFLDDVTMPDPASLPSVLRRLVKCQAARVRADPEFDRDMESLLDDVRACLGRAGSAAKTRS